MLSVITVRIPKNLKKRLEENKINISNTVRNMLERYLDESEIKDLRNRLDELSKKIGHKIDPEQMAKLIREDRQNR